MEKKNKLFCPLMNEDIEDGICFDIHMVVGFLAPEWTAPAKAMTKEDFRKICMDCPNHHK